MTGTAKSAAAEFYEIYALRVVPIPTNKPPRRKDLPLRLYYTEKVGRTKHTADGPHASPAHSIHAGRRLRWRNKTERTHSLCGGRSVCADVVPSALCLPLLCCCTPTLAVSTTTARCRTSWRTLCLLLSSAGGQGGRC